MRSRFLDGGCPVHNGVGLAAWRVVWLYHRLALSIDNSRGFESVYRRSRARAQGK